MDNQKDQQPQDQSDSKIYDFLTEFNNLLKKYEIDEPILNEKLEQLKMSNNFEMSFSKVGDNVRRLKCHFEWKDGRLHVVCPQDI